VEIRERPWQRLGEHEHAFQRGHGGTRVARVIGDAGGWQVSAGVEDLIVLRTTGSGWAGFARDEYTTLPDADDRILATEVVAEWDYEPGQLVPESTWARVRDRLLAAFADHYSPSVQFTLHRMGQAVLAEQPAIPQIRLSLPNHHHRLVDLSPFGLENAHEVFAPFDEPHGLIEGTVRRMAEGG
jgi:urate oxidase